MNQIISILYKSQRETKKGFFIRTKKGLIPVCIRKGEFISINPKTIISEKEVHINTTSGGVE